MHTLDAKGIEEHEEKRSSLLLHFFSTNGLHNSIFWKDLTPRILHLPLAHQICGFVNIGDSNSFPPDQELVALTKELASPRLLV
jgi:hypothetical protein